MSNKSINIDYAGDDITVTQNNVIDNSGGTDII